MTLLARSLATFGFIGHLPLAPGTWASAVTLLVWWLARPEGAVPIGITLAAVAIAGTWAAHRVEPIYGHDDGRVVIDEVAGSLLAIAGLRLGLGTVLAGFLLFRFFDIVKPPPIYQLQALPGGFGVMADDVAAGVAANVVLRLILLAVPGLAGGIG